jgi:hypothetical protein
MNTEFKKTDEEITFYNKAEKLSDRELQELQAFLLYQNKKNTISIRNNVLFFFYLFIVTAIVSAILLSK